MRAICSRPANPDNLGERIASLTQIGVPNRGTPIVDFLVGEWRRDPVQDVIERLSQTALSLLRTMQVDAEGIQDLTRDDLLAFNDRYVDHPQVNYYSVAGVGRRGWRVTSRVILPLHRITTLLCGERNDGIGAAVVGAVGAGCRRRMACRPCRSGGHQHELPVCSPIAL